MRELNALRREVAKLKAKRVVKGTDDCFDDSLVGPVLDDGQTIAPARLIALGYSVV